MKRDHLTFVASVSFLGLFILGLSVQSSADEKAVAKDVTFACSHHGPDSMRLTLSLEKGTPRKVEFIAGNSATKWFVKIDGMDVTPANKATVKVRSGDTITWSIAKFNHGVTFAEQDLAQEMLDFDATVGKPLKDQTGLGTGDADWKNFGTKLWGTDPFDAAANGDVILLASCKVK